MLQADEIYRKSLAPLIADSIDKLKVAETALKTDYRNVAQPGREPRSRHDLDAGDRRRRGRPVRTDRRCS